MPKISASSRGVDAAMRSMFIMASTSSIRHSRPIRFFQAEILLQLRQQLVDEQHVVGVEHLRDHDQVELLACALHHLDNVAVAEPRRGVVDADATHGATELQRVERFGDVATRGLLMVGATASSRSKNT